MPACGRAGIRDGMIVTVSVRIARPKTVRIMSRPFRYGINHTYGCAVNIELMSVTGKPARTLELPARSRILRFRRRRKTGIGQP
jgi:hypothetical protein